MRNTITMPREFLTCECLSDIVTIGVPVHVEWTSMPNAPMAKFEFSFELVGHPRSLKVAQDSAHLHSRTCVG